MQQLHRTSSLLNVPHAQPRPGKNLFFGQLLVEIPISKKEFAEETVNAIILQAKLNKKEIDYAPRDGVLENPVKGEFVLQFNGDIPGYLKVSPEDAASFHVSFREAAEEDLGEHIRLASLLIPTYVLTLSILSSNAGEFADSGFWGQLGNCLFTGISTLDDSRKLDPSIALVFGNGRNYQLVPMFPKGRMN